MQYNDMAVGYSLNIYKGCNHGCIYCSSRGEYYGITDFDNISFEDNVLRNFRNDIKNIERCIVTTGGLSDPYNPLEQKYKLTQKALEIINEFNFGVCIITKSDMITRDINILQNIKTHSLTNVAFSITCADDEMCRMIEPLAPLSSRRFAAIKELTRYGITAGVLLNPILPYITDTEENVRGIVKKAKEAGACYIYATMEVVLEDLQREHFFIKANHLFPEINDKYIRLENSCIFRSPYKKDLHIVFAEECKQQGIVFGIHNSDTVTRNAKIFATTLLNLCK